MCIQSKKLIPTASRKTRNQMGKQYTRGFKNQENKYFDKSASKLEFNGRKQLRKQKPQNSEVLAPDDEEEEKGKEEEK